MRKRFLFTRLRGYLLTMKIFSIIEVFHGSLGYHRGSLEYHWGIIGVHWGIIRVKRRSEH